jgi:hypothetical protein
MKIKELFELKKIEPAKPRNFVAKNAKMGGAGAHKDKKKAQKQGDTKHKNRAMEEASKMKFAGAKVGHKEGPAGQLKGKDPAGYPKGKLVGGGTS